MAHKQLSPVRSPLVAVAFLSLFASWPPAVAALKPTGADLEHSGSIEQARVGQEAVLSEDYLDAIAGSGVFRWPEEKMPVRVFVEPGKNIPGYRSNYPAILKSCFEEWVLAAKNRLAWTEVSRKEDADIVCSFTAQAPERLDGSEAGRTKTHTRFNTVTNCGTIYRATMVLATRLVDRELGDEELRKTFLHEVGHAFGLADHSPSRTDIMFSRVSVSQKPALSAADRATIVRLYHAYPALTNLGDRKQFIDLAVGAPERKSAPKTMPLMSDKD